jgi:hypothetical protein
MDKAIDRMFFEDPLTGRLLKNESLPDMLRINTVAYLNTRQSWLPGEIPAGVKQVLGIADSQIRNYKRTMTFDDVIVTGDPIGLARYSHDFDVLSALANENYSEITHSELVRLQKALLAIGDLRNSAKSTYFRNREFLENIPYPDGKVYITMDPHSGEFLSHSQSKDIRNEYTILLEANLGSDGNRLKTVRYEFEKKMHPIELDSTSMLKYDADRILHTLLFEQEDALV